MAFFKFRWPGQRQPQQAEKSAKRPPAPTESIEVMRRRARHRLIGAVVLVLAGVVGFPLLFDTQPRPIAADVPIDIPDRNKLAPLALPAPSAQAPAAQSPAAKPATTARNATASGLTDGQERLPDAARPAASNTAAPKAAQAATPTRPAPEPKPVRADDAARALALLEGRNPAAATTAEANFIVQVGAFADTDKAREVRAKVERAGLKTYVQVLETKDGKRTRVRVGPYASRAEADKAAARIRALNLSASILTL